MWLFKIGGLALIFLASWGVGFFKAMSLKARYEKLKKLCIGIDSLMNRVLIGEELEKIITLSFERELIYIENGDIVLNEANLLSEDISIVKEFTEGMGLRNKKGEYERCLLYKKMLEQRQSEALESSRSLSRLYNSLGLLIGIFLCIFFL